MADHLHLFVKNCVNKAYQHEICAGKTRLKCNGWHPILNIRGKTPFSLPAIVSGRAPYYA